MASDRAPMRYTFLSASMEPWESPWLLHQPIMQLFARLHNVLYLMDEPSLDQVLRDLRGRSLPPAGLRVAAPGIHELRPSKLFPRVYFSRRVNEWSASMRALQARRTVKRLGWGNPILYMWQPRFKDLIGRLGERLSVFHTHDYYPGFLPEGSRARAEMEVLYDQALRASDVVIACGQALFDDAVEARGGPSGVHLIENGVFFDVLRGGVDKVRPVELEGLPRPIAAYVGRINNTVNLRALGDIARARPKWTVAVIGPRTGWSSAREDEFRKLLSLPNVRYVEGRPASEIGAYLNAIDVGLISYENDGIKDFRFPLKMVEYFAFGKPVVSVELSSIRRFEPLVRMVKSDDEWVGAIEDALAGDTAERRAARVAAARGMDWSEKANAILALIGEALAARGR